MAMSSDSKITRLYVVDQDGRTVFDESSDKNYIIPLYQRAFAWRERQIRQLLEDVNDVEESHDYYIGSLIVSRNEEGFEVVDGQQRLTCLFLLLNSLGFTVNGHLKYACRKKSNDTVAHISDVIIGKNEMPESVVLDEAMLLGLQIIKEELKKYNLDSLKRKLRHVVLYRIEVPEHTDLNRYFETMNVRGEQLEQHDILKASLMGRIESQEFGLFSAIWDACRDMTGYVQMHFDVSTRDNLFGDSWGKVPSVDWTKAVEVNSKPILISQIIAPGFQAPDDDIMTDDNGRIRFDSVIDFPYFLLHCLKVYVSVKGIKTSDGKNPVPRMMNDKKLVDTFESVLKDGFVEGRRIDEKEFAKGFVESMLKIRFLFDKFVIKREFMNEEDKEGSWSIKTLKVSKSRSQRKPYFSETEFLKYKAYERKFAEKNHVCNKDNVMIQSAFRVSYTSPKLMHWITELLLLLFKDEDVKYELSRRAETIAATTISEDFLNKYEGEKYLSGFDTPHIVLNYLDYLLWKDMSVQIPGKESFVFEFRNSIEHWYPRNPSSEMFDKWEDDVDTFGNLCLLQREVNSKFSNLDPVSKRESYQKRIDKGSLKLRLMSRSTQSSEGWKNRDCDLHEKDMIDILQKACNSLLGCKIDSNLQEYIQV